MDEKLKEKLKQYAIERRKKDPKPHDYTCSDWLAAIVHAINQGLVANDGDFLRSHLVMKSMNSSFPLTELVYFRWVKKDTLKFLVENIPCEMVTTPGDGKLYMPRNIFLFRRATIKAVFDFLKLDFGKYTSWPNNIVIINEKIQDPK